MGVMYDARREHPGWIQTDFDDSKWRPAILREGVTGKLAAQVPDSTGQGSKQPRPVPFTMAWSIPKTVSEW